MLNVKLLRFSSTIPVGFGNWMQFTHTHTHTHHLFIYCQNVTLVQSINNELAGCQWCRGSTMLANCSCKLNWYYECTGKPQQRNTTHQTKSTTDRQTDKRNTPSSNCSITNTMYFNKQSSGWHKNNKFMWTFRITIKTTIWTTNINRYRSSSSHNPRSIYTVASKYH